MELRDVLAREIKCKRILKEMTLQELSDVISVPAYIIAKWEAGIMIPDAEKLSKLAKVFDVTELDLLHPTSDYVEVPKMLIISIYSNGKNQVRNFLSPKIMQKVKYLRNLKGMTQEELAKKVGVAMKTVSRWESGMRAITANSKYLPKIAEALGVSRSDLLSTAPDLEEHYREEKIMT